MKTVTEKELTLPDCTKSELINIINKLIEVCGPAAEITLELELLRTDLMRMQKAVRAK